MTKKSFYIPVIASVVIVTLIIVFACFSKLNLDEAGSFFGGLFTSIAFIWIVYGNYQNHQQISLYQKELKHQKEEMRQTREVMESQKDEFIKSMKISAEQVLNTKKQNFLELYKISIDIVCSYICSCSFFDDAALLYNGTASYKGHGLKERLIIDSTVFLESYYSNPTTFGQINKIILLDTLLKISDLYYEIRMSSLNIIIQEYKEEIIENNHSNNTAKFIENSPLQKFVEVSNKILGIKNTS